jgi:aerobic carbon-monoxide dehydrogenase medium subunit
MIPVNFDYESPSSLDDALGMLADGSAKVLAGGMSLIPSMKLRLSAPEKIIDLGRINGLNSITEAEGGIRIGAMATHHEVESSRLLREKCPLLAEAASNIGDVQVRNMGTIGGSAAHADPAADYPASLLALEVKFRIRSASGERVVDAADFFVDTFTTALEPGELITEIHAPVEEPGTGVNYQKMVQPASGYAMVGVAVRIRRAGGKITFARVGVTGLSGKPYRAMHVENAITGRAGNPAEIQAAAALVGQDVESNSDIFASADYRMDMARIYTARAIATALARTA